jgi:hypothetical protein
MESSAGRVPSILLESTTFTMIRTCMESNSSCITGSGGFGGADYSFVAHPSSDGDKLLQLWGPHTARRNGYQAEAVPGIESLPGSEVKIVRDEAQKLTLYEIAIPRAH